MRYTFATFSVIHWYVQIPALIISLKYGLWVMVPFVLLATAIVNKYVGGHWLAPDFTFVEEDYRFYLKLAVFCYLVWIGFLILRSNLPL